MPFGCGSGIGSVLLELMGLSGALRTRIKEVFTCRVPLQESVPKSLMCRFMGWLGKV